MAAQSIDSSPRMRPPRPRQQPPGWNVVVMWLPWRSHPASAQASEATSRSRWRPPRRSRATELKARSRSQNVWNQRSEAVKERPFQVRSMPASMTAPASPGSESGPNQARLARATTARPQSTRLAGWSQSASDIGDLRREISELQCPVSIPPCHDRPSSVGASRLDREPCTARVRPGIQRPPDRSGGLFRVQPMVGAERFERSTS